MAQTYFFMYVEQRVQFEKIPHCPFKNINRNKITLIKLTNFLVIKIEDARTCLVLYFCVFVICDWLQELVKTGFNSAFSDKLAFFSTIYPYKKVILIVLNTYIVKVYYSKWVVT